MKIKRKLNESKHRYQGRSDAFEGRWNCREEKGSDAHRDYFEGFQEGLREAYGSDDHDVLEQNMPTTGAMNQPMTTPPPAQPMQAAAPSIGSTATPAADTQPTAALEETMFLNELDDDEEEEKEISDDKLDDLLSSILGEPKDDDIESDLQVDEMEDLDEVSRRKWIKKLDAEAEASGKESFEAFGQTFNTNQVRESDDPFIALESAIKTDAMINSWNTQLMNLLNEAKKCKCNCDPCECDTKEKKDAKKPVKEGMTVTTTMGNQYGPDSLNINATDEDAHELMRILKHSGISVGLGATSDDHHDMENGYEDDYQDEDCGCPDPNDCDCDDSDSHDMLDTYKEMPARSGMMMSKQDKPVIASLSLQPKSAVGFDDVLGGLMESKELNSLLYLSGQRQKLMENDPSGKGMMSKNVSDKEAKPNQPTDQKAIMGSLKPAKMETNGSLERLQKSHDAGPVDSKTGKSIPKSAPKKESTDEPKTEYKSEKARSDDSASLSEALANDLYKIYAISEDANTDVVSGYKKVSTMAMPRGMGMSVQTEDKPHEPIEPADVEDVMKALDQGAPEPVKFPKLEKLMKAHMPDVEEPEYNEKAEEGETAKITGPIDDHDSDIDDFENEMHSEENSRKKMDESQLNELRPSTAASAERKMRQTADDIRKGALPGHLKPSLVQGADDRADKFGRYKSAQKDKVNTYKEMMDYGISLFKYDYSPAAVRRELLKKFPGLLNMEKVDKAVNYIRSAEQQAQYYDDYLYDLYFYLTQGRPVQMEEGREMCSECGTYMEEDHEQRSSVREALEHDDPEQGRRIDDSMVRMAETYIHKAMASDQGTQQSGIQALNDWKSRFPKVVSQAFESMHKKQQDRPFLNGDMKQKFLDLFEKYIGLTTTLEDREMCSECGTYMEDDHQCESTKEQLEEWANDQGRHGTDEAQMMDTEFMVNINSDGLNRRKINQTTLPHTEVKVRADEDLAHWLRLSGLK